MLSAPDTVPTGSATGNPRNKVALKKGRGLMDWVRLGHSVPDLAGTKGKLLKVTPEELAKHNKRNDAWLALKGNVYNVTPYFEYHPGGEVELMRGVGKDATDLFNEVHKWVNFQSMLQKCLVGTLVHSKPLFARPTFLPKISLPWSSTGTTSKANTPSEGPPSSKGPQPPKHDWFQTKTLVDIAIYTKCEDLDNSSRVVVFNESPEYLKVFIYLTPYVYTFHKKLSHDVEHKFKVKVNKGKVDVLLNKAQQGVRWLSLGDSLPEDETMLHHNEKEVEYVPMEIVGKNQICHNTLLLKLECPDHAKFSVPIGFHVYLKPPNSESSKPYTPIVTNWRGSEDEEGDEGGTEDKFIEVYFKVYPDGGLTPQLELLSVGDELDVSFPEGSFSPQHLKSATRDTSHLFLLGAGTGITPHLRLMTEALKNKVLTTFVLFNRTESDIPWREEFDSLASDFEGILRVVHVLSSPSSEWAGPRGHIRRGLLEGLYVAPPTLSEDQVGPFFCVCGPTKFTKLALDILDELQIGASSTFAFTG